MTDIQKYLDKMAEAAPGIVCRHETLLKKYFHDNLQLAPSSLKWYAYVLRIFFAYLEERSVDLSEIIVSIMNDFYHFKLERCIRKTVNNQFTVLFSFIEYLYLRRVLPEDQYRELKIQRSRYPKARGSTPKDVFREGEIEQLFQAIQDERERMIFWVLFHYALRASELSNLKDTDINLIDRYLLVRESKYNRSRHIPISASHIPEWRAWLNRKKVLFPFSEYVIPNKIRSKSPLSPGYISKIVHRLGTSILGRRVHSHMLRRTTATRAVEQGVPIPIVRDILGHSSIAITDSYLQGSRKKVDIEWVRYMESREDE